MFYVYFVSATLFFSCCMFCGYYLNLISSISEISLKMSNQKNAKMMHPSLTIRVIRQVKHSLLKIMKSKILKQNFLVITNFLLLAEKLLLHMKVNIILSQFFSCITYFPTILLLKINYFMFVDLQPHQTPENCI